VVPITQMVRNGFFFDIVGAIRIVIGIPIMVSVLGI
jgi:solute carrier family 13 (sodium-dependent dicarboxylate transporter), member 2/3/5